MKQAPVFFLAGWRGPIGQQMRGGAETQGTEQSLSTVTRSSDAAEPLLGGWGHLLFLVVPETPCPLRIPAGLGACVCGRVGPGDGAQEESRKT